MVKSILCLSAIVALTLAGCSSDDAAPASAQQDPYYLTAVIVSASATPGSRVDGQQTGDPNDSAQYEDGTDAENTVNSVRFYFFDSAGNPVTVNGGTNYYTASTTATTENATDVNVDRQLSITISFTAASTPAQLFAVLNPPSDLGTANLNLSDLRNKVADFAATATTAITMTNSAYLDAGNKEVYATAIQSENLCSTAEVAKVNPVVMYVERNVAKVRLTTKTTITNDGIPLNDNSGTAIKYNNKTVYFKVTGWNVTATTDKGYLGKHIGSTWTKDNVFDGWNWYPYYRSFWAYNPTDVSQKFLTYNEVGTNPIHYPNSKVDLCEVYINENAGQSSTDPMQLDPTTQVIIAGYLAWWDGSEFQPIEYAEYNGTEYDGETNLKNAMLQNVTLYKKANGSFTKVTASQVQLVTARAAGVVADGTANNGHYRVYLALTDAEKSSDWYAGNVDSSSNTKLTEAGINNILHSVGYGMLWKGGRTYYYTPIRHIADNEGGVGYYGVVRNHIYDITINSLVGRGTPVYDPDEPIWMEMPSTDPGIETGTATNIVADVNILSWRYVPSIVDIVW